MESDFNNVVIREAPPAHTACVLFMLTLTPIVHNRTISFKLAVIISEQGSSPGTK